MKEKILLCIYAALLFTYLLYINLHYLDGVPHVPDETAYLFIAKMIASGHIIQHIPIPTMFVDYFPELLTVSNGTWLFQYPFGHPLLLALGTLIGLPIVIPPLVATTTIVLLFFIAKRIYTTKTALFLLPLPFLSPFFLENSASFMSHTTAAFYLVASFYFLIFFKEKKQQYLLIAAGIFLGLLFNTRPLTCLPFLFLESFILLTFKKNKLRHLFYFLFGFSLLFICYLFYNKITTGNYLHFQYYTQNESLFKNADISFSQILIKRIGDVMILFHNFGPMLFNLPAVLIYFLLFIPFVLRKTKVWDIIFFVSLFTLPVAYFFYDGTFIMYGPRFWYEILPFIFLLVARALSLLSDIKFKITIGVSLLLASISLLTWFGFIPSHDPDFFSPLKIQELKNFNFVSTGITQTLSQMHITNGVIFVKDCNGNWWCYGSVFTNNSPTLTTQVVYLRDQGIEQDMTLKRFYPTKPFYTVDYYSRQVLRIDRQN